MRQRGFTIVELLIVIVIIGILAALVIAAYQGIQDKARMAKIDTDKTNLTKAIIAARESTGKTLYEITGNDWTANSCFTKPDGTDLAALPQSDQCWTDYNNAINTISAASSANLKNLKDPWGRPYYIDENEGVDSLDPCQEDQIAAFSYPFENFGSNIGDAFVQLSIPESACP